MRFFNWLGKFFGYYRQYGFRWLCHHVVTNLVYLGRLVILETEVKPEYEQIKAKIPVNIRQLSNNREDIDRLTKFWPSDLYLDTTFASLQIIRNTITDRLNAGEVCFVAEYSGEIVHMDWLSFHNHHIFCPYEKKRGIGPGEALGHSAYCAAEYRGNHLMSAVRAYSFNYLSKNGYKVLIAYVDPDNYPAMKIAKYFGAQPVQMIHLIKITGISFTWFTKRFKSKSSWNMI